MGYGHGYGHGRGRGRGYGKGMFSGYTCVKFVFFAFNALFWVSYFCGEIVVYMGDCQGCLGLYRGFSNIINLFVLI